MTGAIGDADDDQPVDDSTIELTGDWGRRGRPDARSDDPPVLPRSTRDDTDAGWGERPSDSDGWLREQRPPHWD